MEKKYILGISPAEIKRLEFQHQVWQKATHSLWNKINFKRDSKILDIGCGPGFTSMELSQISPDGEISAFDRSENFLNFLKENIKIKDITNIVTRQIDLNDLTLERNYYDFIYSRWVFSWVSDAKEKINNLVKSLKPGGQIIFQEYINWHALSIHPSIDSFNTIRNACLESWKINIGKINIAEDITEILSEAGFEINHIATSSEVGKPVNLFWRWVTDFFKVYALQLIELGLLTNDDLVKFTNELPEIEKRNEVFIICPIFLEIIATKK